MQVSLVGLCAVISILLATPVNGGGPTVQLDNGTFIGTASNGTNQFLGIPYAQPPSVMSLLALSLVFLD
jgi:hypothetical protein